MNRAYLKYILSMLLFGANGIVASYISLTSYEIVLLRTLLGSIMLVSIFFLTKGRLTFIKQKRQFFMLVISGIAMGASWMFLYEAYHQVGVGIASLLYYCGPVIVMALSPVLFGERLTAARIIGFAAVLCGIFLVNGGAAEGSLSTWGIFCGLMSAVTYSAMVIFNKKSKGIDGIENSMLQLLISFVAVSVFVGIRQGFAMQIQKNDILPILLLGLVNTGIGCYLYFTSIGSLHIQTVAICGYLEPLSAVILAMLVLGEPMKALQIIGAVLILGGALFGEVFKAKSKKV